MQVSGESSSLAFQKKKEQRELNDETITLLLLLRFPFPSRIPTQERTQVCLEGPSPSRVLGRGRGGLRNTWYNTPLQQFYLKMSEPTLKTTNVKVSAICLEQKKAKFPWQTGWMKSMKKCLASGCINWTLLLKPFVWNFEKYWNSQLRECRT